MAQALKRSSHNTRKMGTNKKQLLTLQPTTLNLGDSTVRYFDGEIVSKHKIVKHVIVHFGAIYRETVLLGQSPLTLPLL